ncbi:polyprenyl synthetase superfamily protein [Toxoplasma gondii GT1]|uniref:Polyprenyl synthetase superfamily protein n=4 Tax=Toxoplasma gondii TaxID=5811 RepID=S7W4Y7_TOXGG|nr:polyprenyl synthetase superfamily protein [Toxoplasma gondii GT1]KAF4640493.1 polyprenyl synthetase superfamily protein [Toxoplasma gondii]
MVDAVSLVSCRARHSHSLFAFSLSRRSCIQKHRFFSYVKSVPSSLPSPSSSSSPFTLSPRRRCLPPLVLPLEAAGHLPPALHSGSGISCPRSSSLSLSSSSPMRAPPSISLSLPPAQRPSLCFSPTSRLSAPVSPWSFSRQLSLATLAPLASVSSWKKAAALPKPDGAAAVSDERTSAERADALAGAWRASASHVEDRFKQAFPEVRGTLLSHIAGLDLPASLSARLLSYYARLLDYTCSGGKLTRGILVLYAAAAASHAPVLPPPSPSPAAAPASSASSVSSSPCSSSLAESERVPGSALSPALPPSSFRCLAALGWCVELLQSCFLVMDDVMDHSLTRRGKQCWYRCDGIGVSNAVNDSLVLEAAVYRVLREYLGDHPAYVQLQDLLLGNTFTTLIGQHLDSEDALAALSEASQNLESRQSEDNSSASSATAAGSSLLRDASLSDKDFTHHSYVSSSLSSSRSSPSLSASSLPSSEVLAQKLADRQATVARLKTSHYSFYLPTALGMTYGGLTDPALMAQAKELCLAIGEYFQVQDDYLDCFSDPKISGKIGSDIQEKKCCWLFVQAVRRASREDLAQLLRVYGQPEYVDWVKDLYRRLDLTSLYFQYEEETLAKLRRSVSSFPHDGMKAFFGLVLGRLHKRQK